MLTVSKGGARGGHGHHEWTMRIVWMRYRQGCTNDAKFGFALAPYAHWPFWSDELTALA